MGSISLCLCLLHAGFDILGVLQPGSSLMLFQTDPVVCLTIMALIVVGGLGFFVWEDVLRAVRTRSLRRLSVYSRLVLTCTGLLILVGAGVICAMEWNNPATLGPMTVPQKLLAGSFQSVTTRTAGFAAIDQGAMGESTKAMSIVLMLIGGSSGSTAGGLKTVTVAVLLLASVASARGQSHVQVFKPVLPTAGAGRHVHHGDAAGPVLAWEPLSSRQTAARLSSIPCMRRRLPLPRWDSQPM